MRVIGFDCETGLFNAACMTPIVVCTSLAFQDMDPALVHHNQCEYMLRELFEYALQDRVLLVGHNTAYDLACIVATWPSLTDLVWQLYDNELVSDTIIRQKLSDLARGRYRGFRSESGFFVSLRYDLAAVTHRHLGYDLQKGEDTWRLRYIELLPYPCEQWPEEARQYAIDDAVSTLKVYEAQQRDTELYPEGPWFFVDEHAQVRAAWWLALTSYHGIMTAPDALSRLEEASRDEIEFLEEGLVDAGLVEITYHKHKAGYKGCAEAYTERKATKKKKRVQQRVLEACEEQGVVPRYSDAGKAVEKANKKGEQLFDKRGKPKSDQMNDYICTDRDACLETGDPLLEAYIDYSSALKTLNTDVKAYAEGVENPLHTRFESLAATGRTTSSGPNIQNVRWNFPDRCVDKTCRGRAGQDGKCGKCGGPVESPPGIRECFVPRQGWVFASADYEQLELRTLAQVCLKLLGYSRLAETLNSGKDPHMMVAAQLLGRPYEWCIAHKKDPDVQMARQTGKVANFGFPGGLGAEKLVLFARMAYRVRITVEEARQLKRTWIKTFPEFGDYFKYIDTLQDEEGNFVVQHLFTNRLRTKIFYCVACNSFFQGLGADAAKAAGYLIARACYYDKSSPLYGCRIVNFIHDEWILEVPDDWQDGWIRATAAANELARLMMLGAAPFVPDVPMGAEPQLMRRWSKYAKRLVDRTTGLLIPWDLELSAELLAKL